MSYAGFWTRVGSMIIDGVILGVGSFVIGLVVGAILVAVGINPNNLRLLLNTLALILAWLYYALLESSAAQATLGKLALGIIVTDLEGGRISFGQASVRFLGLIVSALTLNIGFLMVAFTRRKQALHDLLAGSVVVYI